MMRRSLHRIVPTLLVLGLLPGTVSAATSTAERDAHRAAVQSLIEREYRMPAGRQLADFLKAGYPESEWHGKVLSWFYADRFRISVPDKAEAAKLEAEARTLGAELAAAAQANKLPPDLKDLITGSGQVIRLVNDLLRTIGQDVAADKLAASTMVAERKAALNATVASLIKGTAANYAEALAKVVANAKAEEDAWNMEENDPKHLAIIQKGVELRLDAVRPTYFAMKVLREVAERGADFAIDPAPAQAFLKEFATKNFKTLSEWDYNFGDYHPYLRALAIDLSAQATRYKVREASIEDLTTDYLRILDINVAKDFAKAGAAVQEDIRTLQAKTWAGFFAWYRELGKDVAPKYYQAGLDLFQQFKEKTKNDRAFRLDHADRERATEVARIYLQVGRLMQAKGDPAATGLFALVAKERNNPLAWHASKWSSGSSASGGATRAAWGELPIAEDPAQAVATASALSRSAMESSSATLQRSTLLAAAVALRNGVLGMTTTYSEGSNDVAPELWFRYAETLKKLGMRWHAAVVAQAGLRDLAVRMAEARGNPWKGRDGKWTANGRYVSPLAKNAVYYASDLLVAGKGGVIAQLYDDSITLVNKVSPEDGGKALDRMQIVIRVQDKDFPGALTAIEAYLKKYPEEFFDASSLRSTVRMGEYDAAKDDTSRERIAKSALAEAEEVAKKALDELKATKDADRSKVLKKAARDVQALQAFFALRLGQEQKVIEMLGPDYWKNPPDEDKSVQMLGYLCRATKQWYEKQIKDEKKKADPATVTAAWPLVSQVYEIWKTQKQRLPSQDEKITTQGSLLAWVFQNMVNQARALGGPNAPPQLAEIGTTANRAFADLIEPNLHKGSSANTLLGVANVLWQLDEHKRAARLLELWRANIAADADIAMLRDDPKAMLDPLDGPLNGRPELRAAWTELKDLLIDQPDLAKRILEGDLPEDRWGEKKRDYGKAATALAALRESLKKIRIGMGADFQKADEGLAKLEGLIAQLAREIDVLGKMALAYREQGNKAKANAIYDKLIAYDPTNPDFLAATVELTIDQIKKGEAIAKEVAEATQIKAARVRDAAQNGSPTYWTAVIQVLELSIYLKDVGLVDRRLKFDATNQSTPADDLQLLPRNPRDDKRVRRARNALSAELCRRYLEIFKQPGVTAKVGFTIDAIDIDGIATTVFLPVGAPKFAPVRRELEDGTVVFFLWEEGKEPPPEVVAETAPPEPAPVATPAPAAPAPAPAPKPEAKP